MNACARVVVLALMYCPTLPALAQDKAGKHDDLDVTMQIIVDPNAKLPDEVVRHIPLPTSRTTPPRDSAKSPSRSDDRTKGKERERAREARELGREAAETAKERAREAAQQREEARNSNAKDGDKDRGQPDRPDRPNPPRPRG